MYLYFTKWMFLFYKKLRTKKWYAKVYNIEKWDKRYEELEKKKNIIPGMMFVFFLLFVSMRTGMGIGMKLNIQTKKLFQIIP